MKVIVEEKDGIRLDVFIKDLLEISRTKAQSLIKDKNVLVNGKIESVKYPVKINDEIEVFEKEPEKMDLESENIPLDIVYEDDDLLVINKKSGMVVHPAPGNYQHTLVNALLYRTELSSGEDFRPGIVHRLDKDTSGLMLVAKNDFTHERLSNMIKNKEVERRYLALVEGIIKEDSATIDAPIGRDKKDRKKMAVVAENSKEAITHIKVLERYEKYTLIECILETGRTHQIRVHLSYIKHPVVNDPLYGKKKTSEFGQYLHSKSIRLYHPRDGRELFFEQEVPKEFQEMLNSLREEIND